MRRAAAAAGLLVLLAGCGSEDAQQEAAREEVQAHLQALGAESRYDLGDVNCTDAAKTFFREEETSEFVCAVRRADAGCDWFAVDVDRDRERVRVRLQQRDAGCTLPL